MRWTKGEYTLVDNLSLIDVEAVHDFLRSSYWAKGRSKMVVQLAAERSLSFGLLCGDETVGFARVITDFAIFGYVEDVYVLPEHRGKGLGKWMMERVIEHPALAGIDLMLEARKAGGFYRQLGFEPLGEPSAFMRRSPG